MLKLPLELLLEKGLSELGIGFDRRVYAEEVVTEAAFDDAFGDTTVAACLERVQESDLPVDETIDVLTNAQKDVLIYEGHPHFFKRTADPVRGWTVEYAVESTEERDFYEAEADKLVREGKIGEQFISFNYLGRPIFTVEINTLLEDPNKVHVSVNDDEAVADSQFEAFNRILELDGKSFVPAEVSQAIAYFLKETKQMPEPHS